MQTVLYRKSTHPSPSLDQVLVGDILLEGHKLIVTDIFSKNSYHINIQNFIELKNFLKTDSYLVESYYKAGFPLYMERNETFIFQKGEFLSHVSHYKEKSEIFNYKLMLTFKVAEETYRSIDLFFSSERVICLEKLIKNL